MDHDEIWDDSALIESWNDALAEYKVRAHLHPRVHSDVILTERQKYHSIHAKGGSVADLPPDEPKSVLYAVGFSCPRHIINLVNPSRIQCPNHSLRARPDAKPETGASSQPMDEGEVEKRDETEDARVVCTFS
jgi:hypothetical protein